MKVRFWFPIVIVFLGLSLLGTGFWQLVNGKIQTHENLEVAKKMVNGPSKTAKKEDLAKGNGDIIGLLLIPKLHSELPIVEGTDPNDLEKGVGHYKDSFLPGEHGQIVLSGHRDTVFRHLGELKIGDILEMKLPTEKYFYKIVDTKIVDSKDNSILTMQDEKEELILTTCYPFRYIGNAPKRYIIYAEPK